MGNYKNIKNKYYILYDFIACLLIILSHFSNYIIYAKYTRLFPDIILVVGLLCAVAVVLTALLQIPSRVLRAAIFSILITIVLSDAVYEFGTADFSTRLVAMIATLLVVLGLVFFLRKHTNKVVIGAFLAMLFSTLVIGILEAPERGSSIAVIARNVGETRPIIVHLVLDEHMGLAGMTSQLPDGRNIRNSLQEFYTRAGFRLFSHAYSQYVDTSLSLASTMNFDDSGAAQKYLTRRRYGYSLNKNEYLKTISELDYDINIYQSDYFDLCEAEPKRIRNCVTYKPDTLDASEIKGLPLIERVRLITNMYYSSITLIKLIKIAELPVRDWLAQRGVNLPGFGLWHGRVGPIAIAHTLHQMTKDISRTKGGTLFFAHLLMPHYPYVYTPACKVRSPISSWNLRQLYAGTNTPASRRQRYQEYFDQIRCTMNKLKQLFDAMKRNGTYQNAIIIIHGDHGSRINRAEPGMAGKSAMSINDYIDSYSTLFALKAPGVSPAIDTRMLPLPRLLDYAASRDEHRLSKPLRPFVYFPDNEASYIKVALPDLPGLAD